MQNNASIISSKTDYIMVRKNKSMRYVIARPQSNAQNGTILLLQGYGKQVEDYQTSLLKLVNRGFFVIAPDFIGQGKSDKENHDKLGSHIGDYRKIIDDLDLLLNKVILEQLPAPYYILADDMGAIIALAAHDLFKTKIRRQVLIAPIFTPNNKTHHSLFHFYCRAMTDLGLGRLHIYKPLKDQNQLISNEIIANIDRSSETKKDKAKLTLGWYATILDAIGHIFSSNYIDNMTIPTLVYLPNKDNVTHSSTSRELVLRLRMAQSIDLRGAPHDILSSDDKYNRQFWQGFSAFIPGTSQVNGFKANIDWHDKTALIDNSAQHKMLS